MGEERKRAEKNILLNKDNKKEVDASAQIWGENFKQEIESKIMQS